MIDRLEVHNINTSLCLIDWTQDMWIFSCSSLFDTHFEWYKDSDSERSLRRCIAQKTYSLAFTWLVYMNVDGYIFLYQSADTYLTIVYTSRFTKLSMHNKDVQNERYKWTKSFNFTWDTFYECCKYNLNTEWSHVGTGDTSLALVHSSGLIKNKSQHDRIMIPDEILIGNRWCGYKNFNSSACSLPGPHRQGCWTRMCT